MLHLFVTTLEGKASPTRCTELGGGTDKRSQHGVMLTTTKDGVAIRRGD